VPRPPESSGVRSSSPSAYSAGCKGTAPGETNTEGRDELNGWQWRPLCVERALGREPRDVSDQRGIGYDIESKDATSGQLYFVESRAGRGGRPCHAAALRGALRAERAERFRLALVVVEVAGPVTGVRAGLRFRPAGVRPDQFDVLAGVLAHKWGVSFVTTIRKKLIEVALPLEAINAAQRGESHPSRSPVHASSLVGASAPRACRAVRLDNWWTTPRRGRICSGDEAQDGNASAIRLIEQMASGRTVPTSGSSVRPVGDRSEYRPGSDGRRTF